MTDDAKIIEVLARKMSYRDEAPDVLSALRAAGFEVVDVETLRHAESAVAHADKLAAKLAKSGAAQARADALAEAAERVAYRAAEGVCECDHEQCAWCELRVALSAHKEGRSDG